MIRRGEKAKLLWNSIRDFHSTKLKTLFSISELISLDSSEKKEHRVKGKENFFLYVPKIKMKEKRNDSITRQISLNKQFVLPSFEHAMKREWSRDGKRRGWSRDVERSTNRSSMITSWCLDYDGTFCSTSSRTLHKKLANSKTKCCDTKLN